jgi:ComF family protein
VLLHAGNLIVRALLAPVCAGCRAPLERPLDSPACPACWRAVLAIAPPWCARCGDAIGSGSLPLCARCRLSPRRFSAARSAGRYEGALRELVHAFKYQRRRVLAPPLAGLIAAAASDLLAGADAVVPVPLHPFRALQRGFNQADDLARGLGLPVWRVLRRRRHGLPQARMPADRRGANVRHAFTLRLPGCWRGVDLCDRTLVLVDDVMTTGATLDACSEALLSAGVRTVRAVTVARAVAAWPQPRPQPPRPSSARRR